jgi:hypothetical protein
LEGGNQYSSVSEVLGENIIGSRLANLDETDGCSPFSEALTADVEAVLSDQTSNVVADLAVRRIEIRA